MKREALRHRKMKRLARKLDIPITQAIGIVTLMLDFTGQHTPQGNIGKYEDEDIADEVAWDEADAARLVEALVESKWLERHDIHRLIVHDYHDHAEDHIRRKLQRQGLDFVTMTEHDASCSDMTEHVSPTKRNRTRTKPNQTKPNETPADSDSTEKSFEVADSDSGGFERERSRQMFMVTLDESRVMARPGTRQGNSDRTTAARLFDDHIWPAGLPPPDGHRRIDRAVKLIEQARTNATKSRMAYWMTQVRKEWPTE